MYIDIDTINSIAKLIGSLAVIGGVLAAAYKLYLQGKRQSKQISDIQKELTLLCFGVKACLQGIIELGGDGPCKESLDRLEKHLNQKAHDDESAE